MELVSIPGAGRGLRLTRDVGGGEILLEDRAVVVGPSPLSSPRDCVGCYCRPGVLQCRGCSSLVCSPECGQTWHAGECPALLSLPLPLPTPSPALWLNILRLQRSPDPRLALLAGDSRGKQGEYSELTTTRLGIPPAEAARLQAVLASNTFRNATARCLCPVMAMVNHSCEPNCRVYWAASSNPAHHRLVLEARRDLRAGEELTITYCCSLLATPARQAKLRTSKGFECVCARCSDPGERGSNTGGVLCTRCRQAVLLPHLQHQGGLAWACSDNNCGFKPNTDKVGQRTARDLRNYRKHFNCRFLSFLRSWKMR